MRELDSSASLGEGSPYAGPKAASTVAALTDVLRSECRLLQELLAVMQRQREAVAADDLPGVEESVYATHRVLHTLGEARRRRRSINRLLGESDDLSIRSLDDVLRTQMSGELREVRDDLALLAEALSIEVDLNRRVLRGALTEYPAREPDVPLMRGSGGAGSPPGRG